eukprot:TRINITY_DN3220_c0_g1_i2.p1 TRINITY_DN3220_c0_g1~~TRINITY_DN3220_c0_g1_i2.p1  ORF type:complete len:284 (-),score=32.92 TRINITY_DN3220_c0_g1_i2:326-1177(-)
MQWIFSSISIILCFGQISCVKTDGEPVVESDVNFIQEKPLGGDYSNAGGKELILDGKTNERAIVFPKKSIFGKNFKIRECSSSGCKKETLSKEKRRRYDKCNYEGHIVSDPNSKVSFIKCDENGVKDIVIVAEKANLTHDAYRIDPEGKVDVSQMLNFTDEVHEDDYNADDDEEAGTDYADDSNEIVNDMYFDKKGRIISIQKLGWKCNENESCWECCKPMQWKSCQKEVKLNNNPTNEELKVKHQCKGKPGRVLCKGKHASKARFKSCSDLKRFVEKWLKTE